MSYSAIPIEPPFIVPLGPGLWRAHRSSSVIGTMMQRPPLPQGTHGELLELSVTGAQELVAAALASVVLLALVLLIPSISPITVRHGAGATVGAG